ncbi:hypothetical protein JWJ88_03595 [Paracoccus methylovorus]|uniref:Uncharacterized protein n=1 Tax=Paracoccus methylovorus TaxID=2812658 RepID=A0ABX7JIA9_9RHOB|nr:portal protein [Paracoccus methylovorus]QRZ13760.1 hypothetical protein JWJ88_03595 [Paracoccus methylovorus]
MAPVLNQQLRKTLDYRRGAMDQEYEYWQAHFRELRDAIQPTRGRFEANERRSDSSINKRILDNTAQMALRTLRAGLMSGVTSPSRPWFRLGLRGSSENEAEFEVKDWLHEVQRRMYEVMRGSNIYRRHAPAFRALELDSLWRHRASSGGWGKSARIGALSGFHAAMKSSNA